MINTIQKHLEMFNLKDERFHSEGVDCDTIVKLKIVARNRQEKNVTPWNRNNYTL